ncbi:MAG TPA: DinB family protein [Coriobacteriia bacterium]|nr:DinB family protein [Coriobacteriia bacterium]
MPATNHAQIAAAQLDDGAPIAELIARYRAGSALLRDAIADLTPEQLLAYPVPGKMSAQEVVCHVADCEQFLADRMKRTVAMDRPLLVGAAGWLYPEALHYAERDPALDLALVDATRAQLAADLERLAPEAWERVAVHNETGLVTLRQLLLHTVRHVEHHVTTIEEKRAALGA